MRSGMLLSASLMLSALSVAACSGGGGETPGAPSVDTAGATFVGRQACASCHPAQDQQWRGSHHDLAMQEATPETVLGDFEDVSFSHEGVPTRFFREGGELRVSTEGPDGTQQDYSIAYTFGAEPLQQYLIAFPDGRYQALDVAWDSRPAEQGGKRWFHLRPGERNPPGDPLHWTGVAYNWNNMCADCHSIDVRKNYDATGDTYATTFAEIDVACEACHGPGSAHVEWAEARDDAGMTAAQMGLQVRFPRLADAAWNIDPNTGLAAREPAAAPAFDVELCGRCHSRRGPIAEGYEFGAPVSDFYRVALLEDGLYHADGQILDEVFVYGSFRQSRMYQAGVACADCHEPHGLRVHNEGNALCNRCHLGSTFDTREHHQHEPDTPGAGCIDCHMPAATYMVVDPRRDHSFRVPRPDMTLEHGTPNACADCHADRGDRWAAEAVERWFGPERKSSPGERLAAGRSRQPGAQDELRALATDPEAPGIVRATALSLLAVRTQASVSAVTTGLQDPDPLVRAGALMALEGADPATLLRLVLPLLADGNRTVRLEAARLMATVPPPSIPAARRDEVAAALDEFRAAQRVNADRAQAHINLGWLALQQGDLALAEREYDTALQLEPMFVPTHINLADLYRAGGRDAEGEALLRRALEIAPESGDVHHALGLLLVRLERRGEALEELRRAAELTPDNPRYLYVYAVAVQSRGDTTGALRILEEGLGRFPADRDLLAAAATFSREAGELQRAIDYARRLVALDPGDPQAAALLQELTGGR